MGATVASIHPAAEKAHILGNSWLQAPPPTYRFIALRALSPRDPAALCRDIATPAARICYEELQVVTAELPGNLSCVDIQGLCRPTHYTGQSAPDWATAVFIHPLRHMGSRAYRGV